MKEFGIPLNTDERNGNQLLL